MSLEVAYSPVEWSDAVPAPTHTLTAGSERPVAEDPVNPGLHSGPTETVR